MSEIVITRTFKVLSSILIILNIFIPVLSLIQRLQQIFTVPLLINIIGIVSVILLMVDLSVAYFLIRKYEYPKKMRVFIKSYFVVTCVVLIIQYFINSTGYTGIPMNSDIVILFLNLVSIIPFYYGTIIIAVNLYWLNPEIQRLRGVKIELKKTPQLSKANKIWLILSISFCFILLGFGILIDYSYFFGIEAGKLFFVMFSIYAAMLSLFFALISFIITLLIMSNFQQLFKSSKKKTYAILVTAILGFTISSISFIPVLGTLFYIRDAEREFDTAFNPEFGGNWEAEISDSAMRYFKKNRFQLLDYFMGPINYPCIEIKDILYFNGSESAFAVDKSVTLYFDAYLPPEGYVGMPGDNSTLIRIHGGGWSIGDKGAIGMMNRYFAGQGYCVFDIQYGLNDNDLFDDLPAGPENVMGNFTIDDILRHIGNFTYFLEYHASEYGANLDSVFISGGSAGGQLTCATALSLVSKNYTEFSDAFIVKGMVPFYPANNVSLDFALTSRPEWVNPVLLLNVSSPPCLIYQGNQDPYIVQSQILKEYYLGFGRTDCALIQFPFAGHGSDSYYSGFYNQIFQYYMERFLYLYH